MSVQGASHIKKDKECQDYSLSYQDNGCSIAVVADGHGGDDYIRSAIGSEIACKVTVENLKKFFTNVSAESFLRKPELHLRDLKGSIINGWNEGIYAYHREHPFQERELKAISSKAREKYIDKERIESAYGTTLIAVAICKEFWIGLHIGDGKCVAVTREGSFTQPIPWDPKCFLNATTSICDSDALDRFRHFYSIKMPAALFIGSDGIDDCFKDNEQLHNLYKTVLYSFGTTDFDEAVRGLTEYLPRLSAKGSGDDVSIGAIIDLDCVEELDVVRDFDKEKEKARIEENARREAEKEEAERRRIDEAYQRSQVSAKGTQSAKYNTQENRHSIELTQDKSLKEDNIKGQSEQIDEAKDIITKEKSAQIFDVDKKENINHLESDIEESNSSEAVFSESITNDNINKDNLEELEHCIESAPADEVSEDNSKELLESSQTYQEEPSMLREDSSVMKDDKHEEERVTYLKEVGNQNNVDNTDRIVINHEEDPLDKVPLVENVAHQLENDDSKEEAAINNHQEINEQVTDNKESLKQAESKGRSCEKKYIEIATTVTETRNGQKVAIWKKKLLKILDIDEAAFVDDETKRK